MPECPELDEPSGAPNPTRNEMPFLTLAVQTGTDPSDFEKSRHAAADLHHSRPRCHPAASDPRPATGMLPEARREASTEDEEDSTSEDDYGNVEQADNADVSIAGRSEVLSAISHPVNDSSLFFRFSQCRLHSVKRRTAKSWRHPLGKPTARAVPNAVKQQDTSDDGKRDIEMFFFFYCSRYGTIR